MISTIYSQHLLTTFCKHVFKSFADISNFYLLNILLYKTVKNCVFLVVLLQMLISYIITSESLNYEAELLS